MRSIGIKANNATQSHIFSNTKVNWTIKACGLRQKEIKWSGSVFRLSDNSVSISASKTWAEHKIVVPFDVEFFYTREGANIKVIFSAQRGEVQVLFPRVFFASVQDRVIKLKCTNMTEYATFRTTEGALYRAMLGITRGYNQKLKTVGVGYKGARTSNGLLSMTLGYSHSVLYPLDPSLSVKFSRKHNRFDLKGPNLSVVHQTARDVQLFKEPDVYKGKGVRFRGKKLVRKEGKKKK